MSLLKRIRVPNKLNFAALFAGLILLVALACTPQEEKLLQGILENVDSVNGQITVVTRDGETITLNFVTDEALHDGIAFTSESFNPGDTVVVEVNEEDQSIQDIELAHSDDDVDVDDEEEHDHEHDEEDYEDGHEEESHDGHDEEGYEVYLPELDTIKDLLELLGIWEDAAYLHEEEGLSWGHALSRVGVSSR